MLTNKPETLRNSSLTITKSTPTVLIREKIKIKTSIHCLHSTEAYNLSFLNGTATNLHGHRQVSRLKEKP